MYRNITEKQITANACSPSGHQNQHEDFSVMNLEVFLAAWHQL